MTFSSKYSLRDDQIINLFLINGNQLMSYVLGAELHGLCLKVDLFFGKKKNEKLKFCMNSFVSRENYALINN